MPALTRHMLAAAALAAVTCAAPANGACLIVTVPVAFGLYDVFHPAATTGVGAITITCGVSQSVTVALSTGGSGSYTPRRMQTVASAKLDYNLYTDAAYTTIWGNGTGGSSLNGGTTAVIGGILVLNVYGRMPALQNGAVGIYGDTVVATVNF